VRLEFTPLRNVTANVCAYGNLGGSVAPWIFTSRERCPPSGIRGRTPSACLGTASELLYLCERGSNGRLKDPVADSLATQVL
jgi:hypothetical protein